MENNPIPANQQSVEELAHEYANGIDDGKSAYVANRAFIVGYNAHKSRMGEVVTKQALKALSQLRSKILHMPDDEKTNDFFIMAAFVECEEAINTLPYMQT